DPQVPGGADISTLTQKEVSDRAGYDVPRLEDAIALTQDLDQSFCWNLELKTLDSFVVALQTVKQQKPSTAIMFTSFWHDGIMEMIRDSPRQFSYGLLWASHPYKFQAPQWFEAHQQITTLVFHQERLSKPLVQQCHQKNKQIWAYGDRTDADRSRLKRWGINTLISDRPDLLVRER
ncbi:MAG: glycerophosphodiester phosphodiesterase, partial [Cyanobacteria bacterium P01_F01_bin.3]